MIKRLLGRSGTSEDRLEPLPSGRLVTAVDVRADRRERPSELTDGEIERIAARVADRLTQGPMAETLTRVLTEVSERVVREEIRRIRAAAQAAKPVGNQAVKDPQSI